MSEQYSRSNNIELARIPNSIEDNAFEETIINNIEACRRLPLSNAQANKDPNQCKRIIVKFDNRKLPEGLLQIKKTISSMSDNHLNITGRVFVNTSLCPYYRLLWGQCKSLVSKKKFFKFSVLEM